MLAPVLASESGVQRGDGVHDLPEAFVGVAQDARVLPHLDRIAPRAREVGEELLKPMQANNRWRTAARKARRSLIIQA